MSNVVLLNGKEVSEKLINDYTYKVKYLYKNIPDINKRYPRLVVITVGQDEASKVYVRNKAKACEKCNITFDHIQIDNTDITVQQFKDILNTYNTNNTVDGILIQQPLPKQLQGIEQYINISKDVDGFTTYNIGSTLIPNNTSSIACTPLGILHILDKYNLSVEGKHVVIIGRSNIVGKPLIGLLLNRNATVTSCNTYTTSIKEITKTADILITAIGKAKCIDTSYINNKTQIIIDVGINRDDNNKLCGDVNTQQIIDYWNSLEDNITRYITPVPKGVGPMTVESLIHNIVSQYEFNIKYNLN